jgi:hypothetical protein
MRSFFYDEAYENQLIEKGWVRSPMLSPDEVKEILDGIEKLRPNDGFTPDGLGQFNFTYHCTFLDTNVEYKRAASDLMRRVFTPHIEKILVNYEILNCNFYIKPPGRGEFQIHQNWPALADMNDTTMTIWCPLVDADETNGTLEVVEGSHKVVPDIAGPTAEPFFKDFQDELVEKYLKKIPVKAGDALIFDDSLIHWSAVNSSDQPRYAIQILCVPKDATPVFFYQDQSAPDRWEVLEVDSDFFIEHTIMDFLARPAELKSLGFIPNENRVLTEEEFAAKLAKGAERRRSIYFPGAEAPALAR